MSDLVKYDEMELLDNAVRLKAQNFHTVLNREPSSREVKTNQHAGNSKYLPISFMEMTMDELFFGLWETKNFNTKVIANEMVGELEIRFFHPTHKEWLVRVGAGAVQIQMVSEKKGGSGDITDIGQKIKNTLTKDYPHLKAECFRNACLSIGKSFGRDLNREYDDQYKPIIKNELKPDLQDAFNKILVLLDEYVGGDKDQIKQVCIKTQQSGRFTIEFAEETAKKLGGSL